MYSILQEDSTETLVSSPPVEDSSVPEHSFQGHLKNICALATMGILVLQGASVTNIHRREKNTHTFEISSSTDSTICTFPFLVPEATPLDLFAELEDDPAIGSYYRNTRILDSSDFFDS